MAFYPKKPQVCSGGQKEKPCAPRTTATTSPPTAINKRRRSRGDETHQEFSSSFLYNQNQLIRYAPTYYYFLFPDPNPDKEPRFEICVRVFVCALVPLSVIQLYIVNTTNSIHACLFSLLVHYSLCSIYGRLYGHFHILQ